MVILKQEERMRAKYNNILSFLFIGLCNRAERRKEMALVNQSICEPICIVSILNAIDSRYFVHKTNTQYETFSHIMKLNFEK